jgi:hypothetical protein
MRSISDKYAYVYRFCAFFYAFCASWNFFLILVRNEGGSLKIVDRYGRFKMLHRGRRPRLIPPVRIRRDAINLFEYFLEMSNAAVSY